MCLLLHHLKLFVLCFHVHIIFWCHVRCIQVWSRQNALTHKVKTRSYQTTVYDLWTVVFMHISWRTFWECINPIALVSCINAVLTSSCHSAKKGHTPSTLEWQHHGPMYHPLLSSLCMNAASNSWGVHSSTMPTLHGWDTPGLHHNTLWGWGCIGASFHQMLAFSDMPSLKG